MNAGAGAVAKGSFIRRPEKKEEMDVHKTAE